MILTESIVFRFVQYSRNKPKKKDEMMVVCFVPMVYPKVLAEVFPEVSAESKYSIVFLVVCIFIYFMLGK